VTDFDPITECGLDLDGARRQRERYRSLGRQVEALEREPGALAVRFRPGLDQDLLREAIGVEQGCCPFFVFDFEARQRLLRIAVERSEQAPALDGLEFALAS
jgi:hypothetical protein